MRKKILILPTKTIVEMNRRLLLFLAMAVFTATTALAQRDKYKDYPVIYTDTVDYTAPTQVTIESDTVYDPMRVVTNRFGKNWFVFGTVGAHTFRGDYSTTGSFGGTVSPDWSVGVGKWFTPGIGLKLEFQTDARGKPLTDTDTPVRRYGATETAGGTVVTTEGVCTDGTEDKPVLAEAVGHYTHGVVHGVALYRHLSGCRIVYRVGVDDGVILVFVSLGQSGCSREHRHGEKE